MLVLLVVVALFAPAIPVAASSNVVTLTLRDDRTHVVLNIGDQLVVRLPSTPGAGYTWQVSSIPRGLREISERFKDQRGRIGGQTQQIFGFLAVANGGGELIIASRGPTGGVIQRFRVAVTVGQDFVVVPPIIIPTPPPPPPPPPPPISPRVIVLTDGHDGGNVALEVGDTLVVRLSSNPSTGYSWTVTAPGAPALRLQGSSYQPGPSRPGAPGTQSFRFVAVRPGRGFISLTSSRPWDPNRRTDRIWEVLATVFR